MNWRVVPWSGQRRKYAAGCIRRGQSGSPPRKYEGNCIRMRFCVPTIAAEAYTSKSAAECDERQVATGNAKAASHVQQPRDRYGALQQSNNQLHGRSYQGTGRAA